MTSTRTKLTRAAAIATLGIATVTTALVAPAGASSSRPAAPTALTVRTGAVASYLAWKPAKPSAFRVEQATDPAFTQGITTYKVREPGQGITPYKTASGTTYYYRVRALVSGHFSRWSNIVTVTPTWSASTVRVLSYNSMSASLDGQRHPGGTAAPFAKRRAGQLWLLNRSNADVIGIQEAGSCLRKPQGVPCYRQIDSLADGLKPRYKLDERNYTACGKCFDRYTADYILYDPNVVEPVPGTHEDTWNVGPSGKQARFAAYQLFQVKATGGIGVQTWGELLHLKSNGDFVQPNPSDHNPIYVDATIPF